MGLIKWDFLELFLTWWYDSSGTSRTTRKQTMTGSDLSRTRRVQGGSESAGIITISWSTSSMWSSTSLWLTQWQVLRLLCQSWTGKQRRWKNITFLPLAGWSLNTFQMYRGGKICLTDHFKPLWGRNAPKFGKCLLIIRTSILSLPVHCWNIYPCPRHRSCHGTRPGSMDGCWDSWLDRQGDYDHQIWSRGWVSLQVQP